VTADDDEWRHELGALIAGRLDTLGFGVVEVDREGRVLRADAGASLILGRSPAELMALPDVAVMLAPEERHRRGDHLERRRRGEADDMILRTVVMRPDGSRCPVQATLLGAEGGDSVSIVFRDLTDVAERDQYLDWYRSLVERMPVGVTIFDATDVADAGDIRLWAANTAASIATGRELAELIGRPVREVFPSERSNAEAARALLMRDSGRVEHLPDLVAGDPQVPAAVHRRTIVSLPRGGLALLFADITRERQTDLRQRRLAQRIVRAGEIERSEIAMGVHDDPVQQLAAASLLLAQLRRRGSHAPATEEWLEQIETIVRKATESLRRLVFELMPPELVESGLATAIRRAADHLLADQARVDVVCELTVEPPEAIEASAFRIVAEALSNVRKHANARHVAVEVRTDADALTLSVTDDGTGLGPAAEPGHIGLRGMHDRALAVGGVVLVEGTGSGTSVRATLPLHPAEPPVAVDDPFAAVDAENESLRLELESIRDAEAAAVTSARLAWRRLRSITRLGTILREAPLDRRVRAHLAVREIAGTVRDACAIRLVDDDGTMLRRIASWHDDEDQRALLDAWLFRDRLVDQSHAAMAFRSAQPILLDRDRAPWREADRPDEPAPFEPHTAIVAPLRVGASSRGVLSVVRDRTPERLTAADVVYVAVLADLVAGALAVDG
jgi:signal transduction histidine kinase